MPTLKELGCKLQLERLFVRSELEAIHELNKQIRIQSEELSHLFWTTRQHHLNLNRFITNHGAPALCSQRLNTLGATKFVDGYKELGYQESMYANFLQAFRNNPTLAAACLAYGEKMSLGASPHVMHSVVTGIYGNSVLSGSYSQLLELMETLILLQLSAEEEPRRVIRKGNSQFCIAYKLFSESTIAGRLFLTTALQEPIMQVLMEDELYLERDAKRILDCFSLVDIERKFGKRDDPDFQARVDKHIKWTEDRFFEICKVFVESLQGAMFCFPKSLGWLISRTYHIIKDSGSVSEKDARAVCADLMIQMFISTAIVTPELYGITGDAPVSEFSRFNLMQIAQTLQILALEGGEAHRDALFYSRFEKGCVSSLVDKVLDAVPFDEALNSSLSKHNFIDSSIFLTVYQLAELIHFLQELQIANVKGVDQSSLSEILKLLPDPHSPAIQQAQSQLTSNSSLGWTENGIAHANTPDSIRRNTIAVENGPPFAVDRPGNEGASKKLFSKSRGKTVRASPGMVRDDSSTGLSSLTSARSAGSGDSLADMAKSPSQTLPPDTVLVISSTESGSFELPGMLSETEVLELEASSDKGAILPDSGSRNGPGSHDDPPRYSHCSTGTHSEKSAYLSDMGEELSSTTGSSLDDIDPSGSVRADDASSFRGTSSHGNQDEDLENEGDMESVPNANNDEALRALEQKLPKSRESIEDKMRKFEIRSGPVSVRFGGAVIAGLQEEDGPESGQGQSNYNDNRSETWSTDVYASDSETASERPEPQLGRLPEAGDNPPQASRPANHPNYLSLLPRDEDSRSDVWSVEVLPSDSEPPDVKPEDRLQELESESTVGNDDTAEDNRSRASTPSISAISGVSGASGMSLVSDVLHAKADEHGSSSERSYGKAPSSISPDADDMLVNQFPITAGAGGPSLVSVVGMTTSVTSADILQPQPRVANASVIDPFGLNRRDKATRNYHAANAAVLSQGAGDLAGLEREDGFKPAAADVSDYSLDDINPDLSGLSFDPASYSDDTNTIKRSPHQHGGRVPVEDGDAFSTPTPGVVDDDDGLMSFGESSNDNSGSTARNSSTTSTETQVDKESAAASSPDAPSDSGKKTAKRQSADKGVKNVERKKSWWKPSRIGFSALSAKKKLPNGIARPQPNPSGSADVTDGGPRASESGENSPLPNMNLMDEDIMEKYMKKAASHQTSVDEEASEHSFLGDRTPILTPVRRQSSPNVNGDEFGSSASGPIASKQKTVHDDHAGPSKVEIVEEAWTRPAKSKKSAPPTASSQKQYKISSARAIADAQRKLRIALAASTSISNSASYASSPLKKDVTARAGFEENRRNSWFNSAKDEVLMSLQLLVAEAVNLQDHSRIAQLHETRRCIQDLDNKSCRQLLQNLWNDHKRRSAYVTYLVRTKQTLLSALSGLQHSFKCTQRDQDTCRDYLSSIFVKLFLKRMEKQLSGFRHQFSQATAADEKVSLVQNFLRFLNGQLAKDPYWECAGEDHLALAERSVERSIFLYIYKLAIFPNADGDIMRDQLFNDHIRRLQEVVTPQHPALLISDSYLNECPWSSAQAEARSLNAYKTPRDKLAAVLRCCHTIMNLLKLADEGNVPGADDFTPVLVFVLIKANPSHLLSTVQYVQSFLGDTLTGEDSYWWMQFTAATEFIKTIDERI